MDAIVAKLGLQMLGAHALALRDLENGEEPFVYSSGNKGPGYVMVKGLVSQRRLMTALCYQLATRILVSFPDIEYVSGNATGGMVPAWIVAGALEKLSGREIPYFYVRGTRKVGGHGELLTGDKNNDFFSATRRGLVLEELVNFAQTTTNSAIVQRNAGHDVRHAAGILFYDHKHAKERLNSTGVSLTYLMTLEQLLRLAETRGVPTRLLDDYRYYITNPDGWCRRHGITAPVKENA